MFTPYWWETTPAERFWVEIRKEPGTGLEVYIPTRNALGKPDPRWELVRSLTAGQRVLHYDARESRFVGVSTVLRDATTVADKYRAPLTGFTPFDDLVGLNEMRAADAIYGIRDALADRYPKMPLFLPFQFTEDRAQFRMLSNYFAKLPIAIIEGLFSSRPRSFELIREGSSEPTPVRSTFLAPFRPKADTKYQVDITGGTASRSRDHETLVNACALWLSQRGLVPARSSVVDLAVDSPRVIIEAKLTRIGIANAVREALGQLYEYRYFRVVDPDAGVAILLDEPLDERWIRYLEHDRGVGIISRGLAGGFQLSPLASALLSKPALTPTSL